MIGTIAADSWIGAVLDIRTLRDQLQDAVLDAFPEQQAEAAPGAPLKVIVKLPHVDTLGGLVQTLLSTFVPLGMHAHVPEVE